MGHYFNIPLLGANSCEVESLKSYLFRLADAHSVSSHQLLKHINGWWVNQDKSHRPVPIYVANYMSQSINGWSSDVAYIIDVVEKATGICGLRASTLVALHDVMAFAGRRYFKMARSWCSACYIEDKKTYGMAYDRLLWSLDNVCYCPIHYTRLINRCPSCKQEQKHYKCGLDISTCCTCGKSLIKPITELDIFRHPMCEEAQCIEFIAKDPYLELNAKLIHEFFDEYTRYRAEVKSIAQQYLTIGNLKNFRVSGHYALATMFEISRVTGIPIVLILAEPILAKKLMNATSVYFYAFVRYQARPRPERDKPALRKGLIEYANRVRKGEHTPFGEFLDVYGTTKGFCNYWYPALCKEIANARREYTKHRKILHIANARNALLEDGLLQAYKSRLIASQDELVLQTARLSHAPVWRVREVIQELLASEN